MMINITTLFAIFWGLFLMGAAIFFSLIPPLRYNLINAVKDNRLRMSVAFFTICLGATSIYIHNIWESGIVGLITLFGWISFVKGVVIALVPSTINLSELIVNSRWFGFYLLIIFCLGWFLLLYGFSSPYNV